MFGREVADEQQCGAGEHRGGHQDPVVGRGERHAREVRNGQPDESHGTAERRDGSGEQHGGEEDQQARAPDVQSHRPGVIFAQQQQVERFDDGDGEYEARRDDGKQQGELAARDVAQRSHRPDDERLEGGFVGEVLQDLDDRGDARTEHHAEDQDDHDILDPAADGQNCRQHERRAQPGRAGDSERLDEGVSRDSQQRGAQQEECDAQRSPRTDAQHVGAGQRVAKKRLHLQAAGGEGGPGGEGRDGFQQPDFENDVLKGGVARLAGQRPPYLARGDVHRSHGEVGHEQRGGEQREQREEQGGSGHRLFERVMEVFFSVFIFRLRLRSSRCASCGFVCYPSVCQLIDWPAGCCGRDFGISDTAIHQHKSRKKWDRNMFF